MRKIKIMIMNTLLRMINAFIPKYPRSIYVSCMDNTVSANVDVINCGASNVCCFVNQLISVHQEKETTIVIEYYDASRKTLYDDLAIKAKNNNVNLIFIPARNSFTDAISRTKASLRNLIMQFKTRIWINETGDAFFYGKLSSQKIVSFNYFISCKSDWIAGGESRWGYLDGLITTSLLHSQIVSATMGTRLDKCQILGFPRNDILLKSDKKSQVFDWINQEIGFIPEHIIVYAPTVRDYEHQQVENRFLLGYDMHDFESFLVQNKAVFIYKLHHYQDEGIIIKSKGTIKFNPTYDFSFYDLLAFSDCLITDYSSVGYDFVITDRPVIYNLYDLDLYDKDRGMSFEPYEEFCPGAIVRNESEMYKALKDIICGLDYYKEKRMRVTKILHRYIDSNSTDRVIQYIESLF